MTVLASALLLVPALLVVVLGAAAVLVLVFRAIDREPDEVAGEADEEGATLGGDAATPAGDTTEHSDVASDRGAGTGDSPSDERDLQRVER